ncbi:MAG TPA: hypothetical protein VMS01_15400, partial [Stellaceae bacterium]|nr:hypothetical protein [Stellaceae bacterium]
CASNRTATPQPDKDTAAVARRKNRFLNTPWICAAILQPGGQKIVKHARFYINSLPVEPMIG